MAHTQGRTTGEGNPAFAHKRRIIVQLLKDWHLPYSEDEPGWPLNREVLRRWKKDDVAASHRILERILDKFAKASPYYPALQAVFLHSEAGYSDYDRLKAQAEKDREKIEERAAEQREIAEIALAARAEARKRVPAREYRQLPTDGYTDSMTLAENVEEAIDWLTVGLMDVELFCTFPDAEVKTQRTESKEERYLRVATAFDENLYLLQKTYTRARSRAYDETAEELGVSRNTVQRAVKWRDEHPNHGQSAKKHRSKKTKGRLRHGAATTEFSYTDATKEASA